MSFLLIQTRTLFAGALLPLLLQAALGGRILAQASPTIRHEACADGMVSYQGGVNGQIRICGAILQADPKLSTQLDQVQQVLSQQQAQLVRLTRSVNSVGNNLDLTRQTQMLETLIAKLGTNPDIVSTRAGHLTTALEGIDSQITSVRITPADEALLQAKLNGSLGDAIAQLDTGEAVAELNDIRAEVHKIDETTTRTEKDVQDIRKSVDSQRREMDLQLHPERALPPDEAKLYSQTSSLTSDVSEFAQRWQKADFQAYHTYIFRSRPSMSSIVDFQGLREALLPVTTDYQQNLLPQLNAWRGQVVARVPSVGNFPAFTPVADQIGLFRVQELVKLLLQRYSAGDPHPSPVIIRQGGELQTKLANLAAKMHEVYLSYSPSAPAIPAVQQSPLQRPEDFSDETIDGPLEKEFHADLGMKLQAWQMGMKKYIPDLKEVDFSEVKTGRDLQQLMDPFSHEVASVYQAVGEQVRSAAETTP